MTIRIGAVVVRVVSWRDPRIDDLDAASLEIRYVPGSESCAAVLTGPHRSPDLVQRLQGRPGAVAGDARA